MHAFILVLWAFYAPTQLNPAVSAKTTGAIVPTLEACKTLGEATASQVAQMKGVTLVKYGCIEISDAEVDKPV